MLSNFHFLLLSLSEKKQYLIEKGTLLLTRPNGEGEVNLYAVSDFFVEMHVNEQKQVAEIVSFKGLRRLQQHAENICLTELNIY